MTKITEMIVNKIPHREFAANKRANKVIEWFGENITTPENRLILGVTALASQPFFDLYNKDVDEKTRVVSCARTIGKIIAGTLTGVAIRGGFIKLAKHNSLVGEVGTKKVIEIVRKGKETIQKHIQITKGKKIFTPSDATADNTHAYKQYQNAMGTILAIVAMIFTNFIIDAPLTKLITNSLVKRFEKTDEASLTKAKEVANA